MTARRGHGPQAHRTYQEVYHENGRWYGTYKKGKYMFPIDEVSPLSRCFIPPIGSSPCRGGKADLESRPSVRDWMFSTRYSSLRGRMPFIARLFTTRRIPGSWTWVAVQASGVLTWPSERFSCPFYRIRHSNLTMSNSKYPGGIHVGIDLNYIQPELSVSAFRASQSPC
jgi:hypothetical protein